MVRTIWREMTPSCNIVLTWLTQLSTKICLKTFQAREGSAIIRTHRVGVLGLLRYSFFTTPHQRSLPPPAFTAERSIHLSHPGATRPSEQLKNGNSYTIQQARGQQQLGDHTRVPQYRQLLSPISRCDYLTRPSQRQRTWTVPSRMAQQSTTRQSGSPDAKPISHSQVERRTPPVVGQTPTERRTT